MLVLTLKKDSRLYIGDQPIRISISPFEPDTAELWISTETQEEQKKIEALQIDHLRPKV